MAQTLESGDCAVLQVTNFTTAGVYYVRLRGTPCFQRVFPVDSGYLISCDNEKYPKETVAELDVIGKVVGKIRVSNVI